MTTTTRFDPTDLDHVTTLTVMLDRILNEGRGNVRFVLVLWEDDQNGGAGVVSNEISEETALEMLEEAKQKIHAARTHGHA